MNQEKFVEAMVTLIIGMGVFILIALGVIMICSITLYRVRGMRKYCDEQFERISNQISAGNNNTEKLTKSVNQLTETIKSVQL